MSKDVTIYNKVELTLPLLGGLGAGRLVRDFCETCKIVIMHYAQIIGTQRFCETCKIGIMHHVQIVGTQRFCETCKIGIMYHAQIIGTQRFCDYTI